MSGIDDQGLMPPYVQPQKADPPSAADGAEEGDEEFARDAKVPRPHPDPSRDDEKPSRGRAHDDR